MCQGSLSVAELGHCCLERLNHRGFMSSNTASKLQLRKEEIDMGAELRDGAESELL